ncbi:MAG TPA: hypothetical protein DD435_07485 [Cyanobacteria bacterium UBA8530]|nr:hypothetical protein [Cyanobacteria bacterium UBA8530]
MEILTALSREDLEKLVFIASKVPPSTSWDYIRQEIKTALSQECPEVEAAILRPQPEGLLPITAHHASFDSLPEEQGVEGPLENLENSWRIPLTANRQTYGTLLLAGAQAPFLEALAKLLAPPLGLAGLAAQLGEEISKRTSSDKLTGLWNRLYFNERFREECERLVRSKEIGSVAIIALDNFTAFARTLPPEEANDLFAQVGTAVRQVIRQTDWAVRWDGYELLFYFPSTSAEAAVEVLKRFARKLVAINPILETLSGVSSTVETTSPRALIQLATRRLDLARKDGARRVICFAVPGGGLQFYRETTTTTEA